VQQRNDILSSDRRGGISGRLVEEGTARQWDFFGDLVTIDRPRYASALRYWNSAALKIEGASVSDSYSTRVETG